MNTNPDNNLTPCRALDALRLFEPDFSMARAQPAAAETRTPIDARTNAGNAPNEGEDHQA